MALLKASAPLLAVALSLSFTSSVLADHRDDRSRRVKLSEHEAVRLVKESFRAMDFNRDRELSHREVRRYEKRMQGKGKYHHRRKPGRKQHHGKEWSIGYWGDGSYYDQPMFITTRNFHRFDYNRDGWLTKKEVKRKAKKWFRKADYNGNGYLNRRELRNSKWHYIVDERGQYWGDRWERDHWRDRDTKHRSDDRDRDRHRSKGRDKDDTRSRDRDRDNAKSKDRNREKSKDREKDGSRSDGRDRDGERSKNRDDSKSRDKERKRDKDRSKDRDRERNA